MTRRSIDMAEVLDRLNTAAAAIDRTVTLMEICGTHTVAAFRCGLHSLMPQNVRLLSGPGCPVCVTSQSDIDMMVALGSLEGVIVCTYGDMIRVPGATGSLETARSQGAQVRVVYSAMDAVQFAAEHRDRQVVFAAVGFETTTPATAAAVVEADRRKLDNFTILTSHKLVVPAIKALLDGGDVSLDGFLCPGHVSVIIGAEAYRPIVHEYHMRCVIAGFETLGMAAGLTRLTEQVRDGQVLLENMYPQAVTSEGNRVAQELIARVFEPATVAWRALGEIPESGLVLRPQYHQFDAQRRFNLAAPDSPDPEGCLCGQVITGRATPHDCGLFGTACTPIHPIGPCMVSFEGTCQAWFKYRRPAEPASAGGRS